MQSTATITRNSLGKLQKDEWLVEREIRDLTKDLSFNEPKVFDAVMVRLPFGNVLVVLETYAHPLYKGDYNNYYKVDSVRGMIFTGRSLYETQETAFWGGGYRNDKEVKIRKIDIDRLEKGYGNLTVYSVFIHCETLNPPRIVFMR